MGHVQIQIPCRLMSRFFLNLRSIAYDNPMLASRVTTGFALDDASPRTVMMKIMRRKPAAQNTKGTLEVLGPGERRDDEVVVDVLSDRTSAADIDCEAGTEVLELRATEGHEARKSAIA